jgi:hypothetical protein
MVNILLFWSLEMSKTGLLSISFGFLLLLCSTAHGDEEVPRATVAAVTTEYNATSVRAVDSYRSENLKADLLVEWMCIDLVEGRRINRINFWGARIVGMDNDSPLRSLPNVALGDVITRLDGISIARNMFRRRGASFWSPIQVERHYGETEVRWIRSGTSDVLINEINIDRGASSNPGTGPVRP